MFKKQCVVKPIFNVRFVEEGDILYVGFDQNEFVKLDMYMEELETKDRCE